MRRPQLWVCFVVLCLSVGAIGSLERFVGLTQTQDTSKQEPLRFQRSTQYPHPDCTKEPCVALTFDDGPDQYTTPLILDILAREDVPATFFVVGNRIPGQEAILKRAYTEGHEIGNHTFSHPDLSRLQPSDVESQITQTQAAIMRAGVPAPRLIRPPYGMINEMVASHNHLIVVRWNVDPEDWRLKDPAKVVDLLMAQAHPGAIILLHDIQPVTVAALEPALKLLKEKYRIVSVAQLLNVTAGDEGQYFGRHLQP